MDIGITSKATGEDPASETSSTKPNKEDGSIGGASAHPARTDNDALDGRKYASPYEHFEALRKRAEDLGSSVAAEIAVILEKAAQSSCEPAGITPPADKGKMEATDPPKNKPEMASDAISPEKKLPEEGKQASAEVGAELADIFGGASLPAEDAVAIKQAGVDYLQGVIATAVSRAEKAAEFFDAHFAALRKRAEEEMAEEKEEDDDDDDSEESKSEAPKSEGGATPAPSAGGGGEADIAALLGAGESMGAEPAAAAMDPMAGGMGADPMAGGMGADPMAAAGGEMGGDGGVDPAALEAALAELGITPDKLMQMLAVEEKPAHVKAAAAKEAAKKAEFSKKVASAKKMVQELVARSRG